MHFHAADQQGSHLFATYFDCLNIPRAQRWKETSKFLGVTQKTLKLWLSGTRCPPPSAVAALWHECHYGRASLDAHSHQKWLYAKGLSDALQRENLALHATISRLEIELSTAAQNLPGQHVAANCPVYRIGGSTA